MSTFLKCKNGNNRYLLDLIHVHDIKEIEFWEEQVEDIFKATRICNCLKLKIIDTLCAMPFVQMLLELDDVIAEKPPQSAPPPSPKNVTLFKETVTILIIFFSFFSGSQYLQKLLPLKPLKVVKSRSS